MRKLFNRSGLLYDRINASEISDARNVTEPNSPFKISHTLPPQGDTKTKL
jgi:hypothetical protein